MPWPSKDFTRSNDVVPAKATDTATTAPSEEARFLSLSDVDNTVDEENPASLGMTKNPGIEGNR